MRGIRTIVVAGALTAALVGVGAAAARPDGGNACTPGIRAGVKYACGSASGSLSIFPGVNFKPGSCRTYKVSGTPYLEATMGRRAIRDSLKNGGLAYLGVTIVGSLSKPKAGIVLAYYNGRRYSGRGVSFRKSGTGGSFVAAGDDGRRATGSFRC